MKNILVLFFITLITLILSTSAMAENDCASYIQEQVNVWVQHGIIQQQIEDCAFTNCDKYDYTYKLDHINSLNTHLNVWETLIQSDCAQVKTQNCIDERKSLANLSIKRGKVFQVDFVCNQVINEDVRANYGCYRFSSNIPESIGETLKYYQDEVSGQIVRTIESCQ